MSVPCHSVRGALMLLTGLLGSLSLLLAFWGLGRGIESHREARLIASHNRIAGHCLAAVKDFAFERGRTNVALSGGEPISPANRAFVDERRAGADKAIGLLLAELPAAGGELGARTAGAWEGVKALRAEVERDFALPLEMRDSTLAGRWFQAASALVDELEAVAAKMSRVPEGDTAYDRMSMVRVLALQFRNITGMESTRLAACLSANRAPGQDVLAEVHQLRGRAAQIWWQLESGAKLIGDAKCIAALERVKQLFFGGFRPLQDEILAFAASGRAGGVGIGEYTAAAVAALDSMIDAVESIDRATSAHARRILDNAMREMILAVAAMAASLGLMGVSALVLARRITKPLDHIVARIGKLRSSVEPEPGCPGGDEFSKVEHALDLLDEALAERERDARALEAVNKRLSELAVTDELTGLANRRHLNEILAREWGRARRAGKTLAVLLADIDHFKKYNDLYGHQAGDVCLVAVARVLRAKVRRPGDFCARYGGEEFVVILPDTNARQAQDIALDMCRAVESLALPHENSPHARVTISIGVAAARPSGVADPEDLLRLADSALYEAKAGGRNRTVVDAG